MTTSIDSKVSIRIDGKQYQAEAGWTVLRAAREAGFQIPTLCHNEKLAPFSSCFVCVVEVKGAKGFVPSCSTTVAEGMEISVSSEAVFAARKAALELLVSDHFGDCEPPCRSTCPARVPIRDFLALAAKGEYVKAAQKIRETLPFPGSLGRVCPKFCETACRRTRVDEPVSVCFMKRFVSDMEMEEGGPFVPKPGEATGKSVGIVGAGPAGLTAAYFLRLQGHAVTIYEKHECPGGMLKWGIPDYRLPPDVLSRECEAIIGMGVEVKYNTQVGPAGIPFEELRRRHDAMFIAVGAQKSSDMPIEGDTSKGILAGIDFLEQCARGERAQVGARSRSWAAATSRWIAPARRCAWAPRSSCFSAPGRRCPPARSRSRKPALRGQVRVSPSPGEGPATRRAKSCSNASAWRSARPTRAAAGAGPPARVRVHGRMRHVHRRHRPAGRCLAR